MHFRSSRWTTPTHRRGRAALASSGLAAIAALAVAGCGASGAAPVHTRSHPDAGAATAARAAALPGLYGTLPRSGPARAGGTITMGQTTGNTPTYLLPIIPTAQAGNNTIMMVDQLWVPLYNLQVGGSLQVNPATSLARAPQLSDGGRKVTVTLRSSARWSNGRPVTANDVLFGLALLKAAIKQGADNWFPYVPGQVPDNIVGARAAGARAVVITFNRAYNRAYLTEDELAGTLTPMPSTVWNVAAPDGPHLNWRIGANARRIYSYLSKQASSLSTFATNPLWKVVDGPFALGSFNTTNSSYTLRANPRYTLAGRVHFKTLAVETYTSTAAELFALRSGQLDVGTLDFTQLGQAGALRGAGYAVYGYPTLGSYGINLNFKDGTDHFGAVISQRYARQALAHLEDEPGYISGIYHGAAAAAYGPLPTVPRTPSTPADAGHAPYPYSVSAAATLLRAHGWKVVRGGQSTCVRPGTAANDCGAGIPAGTPFKFTLLSAPTSTTASIPLESEALASAAKRVGIEITQETKTENFMISNTNDADPGDRHAEDSWGASNFGGFGPTTYPTENLFFGTGGAANFGGYSSRTADRLIHESIFDAHAASAVKRLVSYYEHDVPMLFTPAGDLVEVVSGKVGGPRGSWLALTQNALYAQYWYLKR